MTCSGRLGEWDSLASHKSPLHGVECMALFYPASDGAGVFPPAASFVFTVRCKISVVTCLGYTELESGSVGEAPSARPQKCERRLSLVEDSL